MEVPDWMTTIGGFLEVGTQWPTISNLNYVIASELPSESIIQLTDKEEGVRDERMLQIK